MVEGHRTPNGCIWIFELEAGSPASYKNCAGMVRAIVEGFIRAQMDPAKRNSETNFRGWIPPLLVACLR